MARPYLMATVVRCDRDEPDCEELAAIELSRDDWEMIVGALELVGPKSRELARDIQSEILANLPETEPEPQPRYTVRPNPGSSLRYLWQVVRGDLIEGEFESLRRALDYAEAMNGDDE